MTKRKVTRGRSSALNIASSRLLMRNRSSANRKFSFDLPSHLLPVKASRSQAENASGSDNSSNNLSNKDYEIQPKRGSEGSRPLMSKRDPTRRNFAFSLPNHLLPVQKERNMPQDNDIEEASEEGSFHQSIKTTRTVQTSKVTDADQENTTKHSFERSHKSNIQEPWKQTDVFVKTSQTAENMETPFLQRRKVAVVRRLVNKFSSSAGHQHFSQDPHTKIPVSELQHHSYTENEKPGSSVQNVNEDCHAESEGDSSHESDIPSVNPEIAIQNDENALSPSHSESSIIMDKDNNSDIRLLKTWASKSVGQIGENASNALRRSVRLATSSVSFNGIGAKEGPSQLNQEISKKKEENILNSFGRSRVGTSLKSKLPIIDPHASNKYHLSLQDDIRFISPMKSTTRSEANHVHKHLESSIQIRTAHDRDFPSVMSNLEMHNKKRQSIFEKFIDTENIRQGDKNVSLQRSSISAKSVNSSRDLSKRSRQPHNKEQAKKVKFNDDMILEVPSVLPDSWLLGADVSRPPDPKVFYLSEENLAYFEQRLPPEDLVFEVKELGDGVNRPLQAMPKAKRKSKQTVVDLNIADQEVLVYKKTALHRRLNDITDLEVAFTVICEAFNELKEEQTEADLRELLDKYEDGVRKDMTDIIKKAIDFTSVKKRMKKLEREVKKQGKEVARILSEKMSIQEQLFQKENEDEEGADSPQ